MGFFTFRWLFQLGVLCTVLFAVPVFVSASDPLSDETALRKGVETDLTLSDFFSYFPSEGAEKVEANVEFYTIEDDINSENITELRVNFLAEGSVLPGYAALPGEHPINIDLGTYHMKLSHITSRDDERNGTHIDKLGFEIVRFGSSAGYIKLLGVGLEKTNALLRKAKQHHFDDNLRIGRFVELGGRWVAPFEGSNVRVVLEGTVDASTHPELAARLGLEGWYDLYIATEYKEQNGRLNDKNQSAGNDYSTHYYQKEIQSEIGWKKDKLAIFLFRRQERAFGEYEQVNGVGDVGYGYQSDQYGLNLNLRFE